MKYLLLSIVFRSASACLRMTQQKLTDHSVEIPSTTYDGQYGPKPFGFDSLSGDMFGMKDVPSAIVPIALCIAAVGGILGGISYCHKQFYNNSDQGTKCSLIGDPNHEPC